MSHQDDVFIRTFAGIIGLLVLAAILFYWLAQSIADFTRVVTEEEIAARNLATLERIKPVITGAHTSWLKNRRGRMNRYRKSVSYPPSY